MISSDMWCTPRWLVEYIEEFNGGPTVGASTEWFGPPHEDGLVLPWNGLGLVFVNPPYSRGQLAKWTAKMTTNAALGTEIIGLVPVATSTGWWQAMAPHCDAILFLAKRVRFVGPANGSPRFDSAICYWGACRYRFADSLGSLGWVVLP